MPQGATIAAIDAPARKDTGDVGSWHLADTTHAIRRGPLSEVNPDPSRSAS